MGIDKRNEIFQKDIFVSYDIPNQLEDFIEDYEKSINYASILSLREEISHLNFLKMQRDFYLRNANDLARIYNTKFSLAKFEKIEQIVDSLEKEFPHYKEQLIGYIDKYNKKRKIQELDKDLNILVKQLTDLCEMKFKAEEKRLTQYDVKIAENKNEIKHNKTVVFNVNIKELFANSKQIKIFLGKMREFKEENQQVKILLNAGFKDADLFEQGTPYIYNSETLNNLRYLKNKLGEMGYNKISFSEYYSNKDEQYGQEWSYKAVIKSNKYISNIINKIQKAKHTPLEAMIFIHSVATLIPFSNQNDELVNAYSPESLRSIVGIIENGEAVCSAYTHLVKAIIDGLEMPGLKAQLNCCYIKEGFVGAVLYKFLQGGNHAQNLITINDDKYKVNGVYRNDCAWDAMKLDDNGKAVKGQTFTFFMNSIKDIQNLKNMVYKPFNMIKMKDYDTSYIKSLKGYKIAKLQTSLAYKELSLYQSKLISFDTFIDAFENTYKKLGLDDNFISRTVFKLVERSCNYADKLFTSNSQNIFKTLGKNINSDSENDIKKSM